MDLVLSQMDNVALFPMVLVETTQLFLKNKSSVGSWCICWLGVLILPHVDCLWWPLILPRPVSLAGWSGLLHLVAQFSERKWKLQGFWIPRLCLQNFDFDSMLWVKVTQRATSASEMGINSCWEEQEWHIAEKVQIWSKKKGLFQGKNYFLLWWNSVTFTILAVFRCKI